MTQFIAFIFLWNHTEKWRNSCRPISHAKTVSCCVCGVCYITQSVIWKWCWMRLSISDGVIFSPCVCVCGRWKIWRGVALHHRRDAAARLACHPGCGERSVIRHLQPARRHRLTPTLSFWWINTMSSCKHIPLLLCISKPAAIHLLGGAAVRGSSQLTFDLWLCCSLWPVTGKLLKWLIELWKTNTPVRPGPTGRGWAGGYLPQKALRLTGEWALCSLTSDCGGKFKAGCQFSIMLNDGLVFWRPGKSSRINGPLCSHSSATFSVIYSQLPKAASLTSSFSVCSLLTGRPDTITNVSGR